MNPSTSKSTAKTTRTVFLFGDATDSWVDGLEQLYKHAVSTPWLKVFLDTMTSVITQEANLMSAAMDRPLRNSLGHFSSLQELGDRYRRNNPGDPFGVVQAVLLHTVRAGTLLLWAKREPQLIGPEAATEWVGLSGGLLTLSALAVAHDFNSLNEALLETGRLVFRVAMLASTKSRAMEEEPGTWGWAVLGISAEELREALDQFHRSNGIMSKKAKVGVTGNGWNTVIGPPSLLRLFLNQSPAVRSLAKNPLEIKAAQHTLDLTTGDVEAMVGSISTVLARSIICPRHHIFGMDDPAATYTNWGDMLRDICTQVLSRPLDISQVMDRVKSSVDGIKGEAVPTTVRIVQPGNSSHASFLADVLRKKGRDVLVLDQQAPMQALLDDDEEAYPWQSGRIAIVGMSGRGPGSDNVDEFWDHIMAKDDLCSEVPKDRFDIQDYYCPSHERGDQRCKMKVRYGCFMDKPGHFDARFFHISPREALLMDPNHRQFLMSTYEALESAGYADGATRTTDPNRIAAFFAQATDDWHKQTHGTLGCDSYTLQGIQRAFGPGRLAWQFKWEGPTYALDSACAGATSSIHLACLSLLAKDIDMAVAGAANILSWPHSFTCLDDSGILSPTGNCKTFRDDADGYCRGDFVGAVVLKRLEDAVAQHDNILAVIAGSGRNHSGNSTSITTSDAAAQERLFHKVLRNAQLSPDDISYVEMHGTGTQTGDPAEVGAVANTFKHRRRRGNNDNNNNNNGLLPVGGLKANFGHSEAAAGIAEVLKCIKMFQTNTIPPQAGMPHALNPKFPVLSSINIEIPSEPKPFTRQTPNTPRRILVNNFDAAGGNSCLVLEEFLPRAGVNSSHRHKHQHQHQHEQKQLVEDAAPASDSRLVHIVTSSARTQTAYHANKRKLAEWLRANPEASLQDVGYTTTARRMHHPFRFSCTAASVQDLISKLEAPDATISAITPSQPVVFVFTGQGSHYAGMGAELYRISPIFRETVDLCASLCDATFDFPSFVDIIVDPGVDVATKNTVQTQLAVVTLEMALTTFWRSIGLQPSMVMGHSLGEFAALHAAGVLSLVDTLYLVGSRALLLLANCELGACSMVSVSTSASSVRDRLALHPNLSCSIACINSPSATVVSGTTQDLAQFEADLVGAQDSTVRTKTLTVPFAFHSFQMDSILQDLVSLAGGVTYSAPKIPVSSTLLGSIVQQPGVFNQDYIVRQSRQPVDFVGALHAVKSKLNDPIWLEIGPAPVCVSFVRSTVSPPSTKVVHSLAPNTDNWKSIASCLSAAYVAGVDVDWLALHRPFEAGLRLTTLPAYAWDTKDYWIAYTEDSRKAVGAATQDSSSTAPPLDPALSTCAQYLVEKTSSPADGVRVTFRAAMSDPAFLALIDGHKMQQVGLCSGSVFCDAALTVATYALKYSGRQIPTRSLSLHDPELLAPLTRALVGVDGELHTTAVMASPSADTILITFKTASSSTHSTTTSRDLGSMKVWVRDPEQLQAEWDRTSYFIKEKMEQRTRDSKDGKGHRMRPEVVYALFSRNVEFGTAFQCIQEGFVAADYHEASARVVLGQDPAGSTFTFSPYWGEALAHLAGFLVNGDPKRDPRKTFIVMGFGGVEQTVEFVAGKEYLVYSRISRWEDTTAFCDAFIFDAESLQMVMRCYDLRYQQLPRASWKTILEGGHASSASHNGPPPSRLAHHSTAVTQVAHQNGQAAQGAVTASADNLQEEQKQQQEQAAPSSDSLHAFETILDSIVKATMSDPSEFTDETLIADLGVDSIMAIEIVSDVREKTGIDLPAQFAFEYPTIGDLRRDFAAPSSAPDNAAPVHAGDARLVSGISAFEKPRESESVSSLESAVLVSQEEATTLHPDDAKRTVTVDDKSPMPNARITLLQGRPGSNKTPFYMMADGTGSIATYIHLPIFEGGRPIYGVDSPFLRCPSRLTPEVGIEGVAKLVVEALVKHHPTGNFIIGGFSAGSTVAYEVARRLPLGGRKVDGLLVLDLCCPRPDSGLLDNSTVNRETDVGIAVFGAAAAVDNLWTSTGATRDHLRAYLFAMRNYHPPPMSMGARPAAAAVIWAEKGMVNRVKDSPEAMQMLLENGIPIKAYPGFMEDPKNGPFACFIPDKTEADLGPNGWDRYVGDMLCLSMDADHLDMPMPGHVHLLHKQMTKVLAHFSAAASK